MNKRRTKIWIVLIALPFILLIGTALMQFVVRFLIAGSDASGSDNVLVMVVNILSLLIGIASVVCLVGIPVWIIMLVRAIDYNKKLQSQASDGSDAPQPPQPPKA